MDSTALKKLGFSDKSLKVYTTLLSLGPTSVRNLAEECGLNRGTTYDVLKALKEDGLVDYFHKDTKQTFVATDPEMLERLFEKQKEALSDVGHELKTLVPELQALHHRGKGDPVARYYDAHQIPDILHDVLDTCEKDDDALYRIYSTKGVREYLYHGFSEFSEERIKRGVSVKVIAVGEGGELRGLDERKWLAGPPGATPTSIIIYPGKTAYISLDAKGEPVGVVIQNQGVYDMQKRLFEEVWEKL